MGKKIYFVAECNTKDDSIIVSTIRVFSSRDKQTEYIHELRQSFGYISGTRSIMAKVLLLL